MTLTPAGAIDAVNAVFGRHPGRRALHAKGVLCRGSFTPDPAAAGLTRAAHLHGGTLPATMRFSNAAGDPTHPDWLPDPRGLAIKLYLPDGARTDIVAVSSPWLPVSTPEQFIALIEAQGSGPRPGLPLLRFLARHRDVARKLPSLLDSVAPRASYAGIAYYGIHAFRWRDAEDRISFVRYTLAPDDVAAKLSARAAKRDGPDYLQRELSERLSRAPIGFTLTVTVADVSDPTDDPSAVWPKERQQLTAGRVTIDALDDERERGDDVLVFDPTRVIDGVECSDDPVLRFRAAAYSESVARRTAP